MIAPFARRAGLVVLAHSYLNDYRGCFPRSALPQLEVSLYAEGVAMHGNDAGLRPVDLRLTACPASIVGERQTAATRQRPDEAPVCPYD
jgi:hypothetical protein